MKMEQSTFWTFQHRLERFGSSGDPTKYVNVTDFPSPKLRYETIHLGTFNITSGKYFTFSVPIDLNTPIFCGGYSKLSIMYEPLNYNNINDFTLYLSTIKWYTEAYSHYVPWTIQTIEFVHLSNSTYDGQLIYLPEPALVNVKAPYFALTFTTETDSSNWMNMWVVINVWVYLRNE
jgi:hypothetical protein